jgi:hypothetical protein
LYTIAGSPSRLALFQFGDWIDAGLCRGCEAARSLDKVRCFRSTLFLNSRWYRRNRKKSKVDDFCITKVRRCRGIGHFGESKVPDFRNIQAVRNTW